MAGMRRVPDGQPWPRASYVKDSVDAFDIAQFRNHKVGKLRQDARRFPAFLYMPRLVHGKPHPRPRALAITLADTALVRPVIIGYSF
jgi:hypothetical protein